MADYPFPRGLELNKDLKLHPPEAGAPSISKSFVDNSNDEKLTSFFDQAAQFPAIPANLSMELLTPDLSRLSPYLWLVGTQQSNHISPLHHQIVKGREIIISENIELHCTWLYDRVFLKPIPPFLLSWAFWQRYLVSDSSPILDGLRRDLQRGAIGYLRTYFYLIKYPSDFRIARQEHLIPEDTTYEETRRFFLAFAGRPDTEVSPRFAYGELQLGRLNFWAKVFLRRIAFQKVQTHDDYNMYFTRFYGPLIFLFAVFSVVLSAMQVLLTANPPSNQTNPIE